MPKSKYVISLLVVICITGCKTSPSSEDMTGGNTSMVTPTTESGASSSAISQGNSVVSTADKNSVMNGHLQEHSVSSGEFNLFPRQTNGWDDSGWSIITPSDDSRLIYVSSSYGDDATAEYYAPRDIENLEDPGLIKPYKTIEAGLANTRENYPDWVLLMRGDVWRIDAVLKIKSGRSPLERTVLTAYGANVDRPVIEGTASEIIRIWDGISFVAITGISIYAPNRNPESTHFWGWGSVPDMIGIRIYKNSSRPTMSILIEDNELAYFGKGISIDGGGEAVDVIIRRNVIQKSYSEKAHSQGIYAGNSSILLEENILYHNGWYQQQVDSGNDKEFGQATMFNHNTYFPKAHNTIFKKNIFISASSIHNKWTADSDSETQLDSIEAQNLVIESNIYIGGEIGISAGGNTDFDTGPRWENIEIKDNIMFSIGSDRPTNRKLGWYIDASDWDTGVICGNYLLHNNNETVTNLRGIELSGHSSDVTIKQNFITGLINTATSRNAAAFLLSGEVFSNILVADNKIQMIDSLLRPLKTHSLDGIEFVGNSYYSAASNDEWFKIANDTFSFDSWLEKTGENGAKAQQSPMSAPIRSFESYAAMNGLTYDQMVLELTRKSKSSWQREFTADGIIDYIKAGYGSLSCD